jgi:hypothetical protein
LLLTTPLAGQTQFIIADRNNDALYRVRDLNNDGIISDPGEVFAWFNSTNADGTLTPNNPTAQAISVCRVVVMGDQGNQVVYRLVDVNDDGDALDLGESKVFAQAGNAAGIAFAFPTGAAFDSHCIAYVVNAGNASGNDAIYRLEDLNGDGDVQDNVNGVNEITIYVGEGAFGPGNGPYSPQELYFDANDVGYLRNSGTLNGIYRFEDITQNGRADDAGEFTLFFGPGNASGVTISAGFALDPDRAAAPGVTAMYSLQTATGGVDQIIRCFDFNNDHDAQDAGEAALVWSYAAAGFTGVDLVSLRNGDVLVTDNSGFVVARLHDFDADGDFLDAGEQTNYYTPGGTLAQVRQMDALCRTGDVNGDGFVNTADLLSVINAWGKSTGCTAPDINCSGGVNTADLLAVINSWG